MKNNSDENSKTAVTINSSTTATAISSGVSNSIITPQPINVTIDTGSFFNITNLVTSRTITEIATSPFTVPQNLTTVLNTNISRHYAEETENFGTFNVILLSVLGLIGLFFGSCVYVICVRRNRSKEVVEVNNDQDPAAGTSDNNNNGDEQSLELLEHPFRNLLYVYPTFIKSGRNEISTTGDQVRATCKQPGNTRSSTIILTMSDNLLFVETEEHLPVGSTNVSMSSSSAAANIVEANSGNLLSAGILNSNHPKRKTDHRLFLSDTDDDDDEDYSDIPTTSTGKKLSSRHYIEPDDDSNDFTQPIVMTTSVSDSAIDDKYLTPNTGAGYAKTDLGGGSSCSSNDARYYPSNQLEYQYERQKFSKLTTASSTIIIDSKQEDEDTAINGNRVRGASDINRQSSRSFGQSSSTTSVSPKIDNDRTSDNNKRRYYYPHEISSSGSENSESKQQQSVKQSPGTVDNINTPVSSIYKSPTGNTR